MGLVHTVDRLLFPNRCLACRVLLAHSQTLCDSCHKTLRRRNDATIRYANAPFRLCIAPYPYNATGRQMMHHFKFHGQYSMAAFWAQAMAEELQKRDIGAIDYVTWVPLSWLKYCKRGYSQSYLMAKQVADALNVPLHKALIKIKHTKTQSRVQGVQQRRANVKGAFRADAECVKGKRVLLIDDIWTTGATMLECCHMLRRAKVQGIVCATAVYNE